ncbi:MAG: S66 peptidase family protein [bacterium]
MIHKPRIIKRGDTIGIVAPAGPFDKEKFILGTKRLNEYGFKIKFLDTIFAKKGYLAGTDKRRADEINTMFCDKDVHAIFCARGGYGSARLIPLLKADSIKKNPKIFIGFSDITVLHLFIHKTCSMVSFHGPMVATDQLAYIRALSEHCLLHALTKDSPLPPIPFSKNKIVREGRGKGVLIGGCLTLLIHSLGTHYEIDTDNKILLIEDRKEAPYRIDRMLYHLKAAGKLEKINGVVFGDILTSTQGRSDNEKKLRDLINEVFDRQNIPICIGLPFGHALENLTIPLGIEVTLDTDKCRLIFDETATVG